MFILLVVCLPSYGVHAYEFKESIGKDWTMNSTTELGRWFNETEVKIILEKAGEIQTFRLKDKRKVNNLVLNELNLTKNILVE